MDAQACVGRAAVWINHHAWLREGELHVAVNTAGALSNRLEEGACVGALAAVFEVLVPVFEKKKLGPRRWSERPTRRNQE